MGFTRNRNGRIRSPRKSRLIPVEPRIMIKSLSAAVSSGNDAANSSAIAKQQQSQSQPPSNIHKKNSRMHPEEGSASVPTSVSWNSRNARYILQSIDFEGIEIDFSSAQKSRVDVDVGFAIYMFFIVVAFNAYRYIFD